MQLSSERARHPPRNLGGELLGRLPDEDVPAGDERRLHGARRLARDERVGEVGELRFGVGARSRATWSKRPPPLPRTLNHESSPHRMSCRPPAAPAPGAGGAHVAPRHDERRHRERREQWAVVAPPRAGDEREDGVARRRVLAPREHTSRYSSSTKSGLARGSSSRRSRGTPCAARSGRAPRRAASPRAATPCRCLLRLVERQRLDRRRADGTTPATDDGLSDAASSATAHRFDGPPPRTARPPRYRCKLASAPPSRRRPRRLVPAAKRLHFRRLRVAHADDVDRVQRRPGRRRPRSGI